MRIRGLVSSSISTILLLSAVQPATAADLGSDCCGDLEERIAELEAVAAHKGNRVVSLQIYGQVNKALMFWDDGHESDVYIVDNQLSSSRVGFKGSAKISPWLRAGYNIEFEIADAQSEKVNQQKNGDDPEERSTYILRQNYWYVDSDKYGRLSLGHQSVAADGAYEVNLSNSLRTSGVDFGNSFFLRRMDGSLSRFRLGDWADNFNVSRNDVLRYDTPSFYGFILSASWGDNDYADVALRFRRDFGALRVAGALAYQWDNQYGIRGDGSNFYIADNETIGGSISILHVPTGFYTTFQAAERDYKNPRRLDGTMWYLQVGVDKRYFPIGTTTVYSDFGEYSNVTNWRAGTDRTATRWGGGINQKIDSAAMDVYMHATFWDFEDSRGGPRRDYEDFSTLVIGSRIKF